MALMLGSEMPSWLWKGPSKGKRGFSQVENPSLGLFLPGAGLVLGDSLHSRVALERLFWLHKLCVDHSGWVTCFAWPFLSWPALSRFSPSLASDHGVLCPLPSDPRTAAPRPFSLCLASETVPVVCGCSSLWTGKGPWAVKNPLQSGSWDWTSRTLFYFLSFSGTHSDFWLSRAASPSPGLSQREQSGLLTLSELGLGTEAEGNGWNSQAYHLDLLALSMWWLQIAFHPNILWLCCYA